MNDSKARGREEGSPEHDWFEAEHDRNRSRGKASKTGGVKEELSVFNQGKESSKQI